MEGIKEIVFFVLFCGFANIATVMCPAPLDEKQRKIIWPATCFFERLIKPTFLEGQNLSKSVKLSVLMYYLSVLQELPKYLRGYHVCTKEEMVKIATLLFRVKANNDKTQFVMIPKLLKELVPGDQLKAMSENEWKKVWRSSSSLLIAF